jgi:hypothetical protein
MAHFLPRQAASLLNWADKYVFLVRAAAQADWHAMRRNQGLPLRVLLLRRLPALSLLPGQTPAQLARWAAVENWVTSIPISAIKLQAAIRSTPGIGVQRSNASARSRCSLPIWSSRHPAMRSQLPGTATGGANSPVGSDSGQNSTSGSPRPTRNRLVNIEPDFQLKIGTRFGTRCMPKVLQIRHCAPCKSLKRRSLQALQFGC